MSMRTRFLTLGALAGLVAICACNAATGDAAKSTGGKTTPAAAAKPLDAGSTVAMIGDQKITLADLDASAAAALARVRQQEFDVRKQSLESLVNDRVLDKEAAAKGIAKDALVKAEVTDKVGDPAQTEIDAWYEQNKARMGTQTKEQMQPQIAQMLKSQKMQDVQRSYVKGLRQKYGAKILLEPPRVEVSLDDDPSKGPDKAPVTIVEFSDYQCPFCSRAENTVQDVLKKYGDKIHFVYRDYPLPFHANANIAAQAAQCAADQGKFWEMHAALFANQQKLTQPDLIATAGTLGVDAEKFKTCLESGKFKDEVQKDLDDGQKYGVTGTPTFFINGIPLVGAQGPEAFADIIDSELDRKH